MKKSIKIVRSATGGHTIVTVTLAEDGVTAVYGYKSAATKISESVDLATRCATDMLNQVKAAVAA